MFHLGRQRRNARVVDQRQNAGGIHEIDMDLAFGLQKRFEEGYMHMAKLAHARVPSTRIALSGGCALNSVANGKIFERTPFEEVFIQPAAGDNGTALGAALYDRLFALGHDPGRRPYR